MRRCESNLVRSLERAQLSEMDRTAVRWAQSVGGALMEHVAAQNLPARGADETAHWKPPFNQLGQVLDRGCLSDRRVPPDVFNHTDRHSFNLWQSAVTPCEVVREATDYGVNRKRTDGARLFCASGGLATQEACLVYSVGSAGKYGFEREILRRTRHCQTHTFDCTMKAARGGGGGGSANSTAWITQALKSSHLCPSCAQRGSFHPFCLSARAGDPGPQYLTLDGLRALLGHEKAPSLLKMDIEGFERAILYSWRASDAWLPEQLFLEVHCYSEPLAGRIRFFGAAENVVLLQHLHALGYRLTALRWEGGGVDATLVRTLCPIPR